MLPAETCLAPLCTHFLQTRYLGEEPIKRSEEIVRDGLMVKVTGDAVHDNFYKVKAVWSEGVNAVQRGVVCVLAWEFQVKGVDLDLLILKAEVVNLEAYPEIALTPLERNPQVKAALHRMRFQAASQLARSLQVGALPTDQHSDSEIEELPAPTLKPPVPPPNTPMVQVEHVEPAVPTTLHLSHSKRLPEEQLLPIKRKAVFARQFGSAFLPYKRPNATRSSPVGRDYSDDQFSKEDLAFLKYYMGI